MLLATFSLAACGGRQATPIAAEPIDAPLAAARPATRLDTTPTARPEPAPTAPSRPAPPAAHRDGRDASPRGGKQSAPQGVRHVLKRGQTLYSVARLYDVPLETLVKANKITDPNSIRAGTRLFIPGATEARGYPKPGTVVENRGDERRAQESRAEEPARDPARRSGVRAAGLASFLPDDDDGSDVDHEEPDVDRRGPKRQASNTLAWPLQGPVTGPYGRRGKNGRHAGIDIDGRTGDPIKAAASGVVVESGPDGPYGRRVIIDHGDGWTTLYAHAERLLVKEGETVHVGQRIAVVGRSGNARGTHLHFEVRHDGRTVNPSGYLAGDRLLTAGVQ
jgi:murein DD-endopeptidase MepM/ murein hydrolase activator NlpD